MTFLWESIAFGPIHSRRLGRSLGINLLPTSEKICSFDCLYCECGWTLEKNITSAQFYPVETVLEAIEHKLKTCLAENTQIDSITFSGNGEPTLHPQFDKIIEGLLQLRQQYYPAAVITCLSNSTQLFRKEVRDALMKIDNPILKLDAGTQEMLDTINNPIVPVDIDRVVNDLCSFDGKLIIQTLFLKGIAKNGLAFDNSTEPHLSQWLALIKKIRPLKVMIYSLDRETPAQQLKKIPQEFLMSIAEKVKKSGFDVSVY